MLHAWSKHRQQLGRSPIENRKCLRCLLSGRKQRRPAIFMRVRQASALGMSKSFSGISAPVDMRPMRPNGSAPGGPGLEESPYDRHRRQEWATHGADADHGWGTSFIQWERESAYARAVREQRVDEEARHKALLNARTFRLTTGGSGGR